MPLSQKRWSGDNAPPCAYSRWAAPCDSARPRSQGSWGRGMRPCMQGWRMPTRSACMRAAARRRMVAPCQAPCQAPG